MKHPYIYLTVIISIFLSSFSGCVPDTIDPVDIISEDDNLGLLYMREEEKLARDVYITLFEIHGIMFLITYPKRSSNIWISYLYYY